MSRSRDPVVIWRHGMDLVRTSARRTLPLMPALETAESVLRRRQVRALRALEDAEVARLVPQVRRAAQDAEAVRARRAEPQVTVVVPTYRRGEQLRQAVDSALLQGCVDLRVVVVDDGGGQVEGLPQDPRLTVLQLSANFGVAGLVRNVGLRLSRSRYVAFLDDDNTWLPGHLSDAIQLLEAGADLVYSDLEVVDVTGAVLREHRFTWDRAALRHWNHVDTSSVVARREVPDGVPLRFSVLPRHRGGYRGEDWELVYRLSRGGRVQGTQRTTVRYLVNPQSAYSDNRKQVGRTS